MANRLKEMRYKRMLSMSELARRSGISRAAIYLIETKPDRNVTAKTMEKLAKALDMPITEIFFADDG